MFIYEGEYEYAYLNKRKYIKCKICGMLLYKKIDHDIHYGNYFKTRKNKR